MRHIAVPRFCTFPCGHSSLLSRTAIRSLYQIILVARRSAHLTMRSTCHYAQSSSPANALSGLATRGSAPWPPAPPPHRPPRPPPPTPRPPRAGTPCHACHVPNPRQQQQQQQLPVPLKLAAGASASAGVGAQARRRRGPGCRLQTPGPLRPTWPLTLRTCMRLPARRAGGRTRTQPQGSQ